MTDGRRRGRRKRKTSNAGAREGGGGRSRKRRRLSDRNERKSDRRERSENLSTRLPARKFARARALHPARRVASARARTQRNTLTRTQSLERTKKLGAAAAAGHTGRYRTCFFSFSDRGRQDDITGETDAERVTGARRRGRTYEVRRKNNENKKNKIKQNHVSGTRQTATH